jgi:sigma-54 dependent transcriptional regulator, acetoin dehydrogenase operon transcriptional activator AcoR
LADGAPIDVIHFTQDFLDELSALDENAKATSPALISPTTLAQPSSLKTLEDGAIERAMQQHHGNISAVARQLGVSRNTLYRKLKLLGLI